MSRFSIDAIKRFRKTFDIFDIDGDGVINESELHQVALRLGYRLSRQQVEVSFQRTLQYWWKILF